MRYQLTRPNGWLHDRWHFYKYVSAKTLKIMLKTGSVRWSRPSLFNDPFDTQANFFAPSAGDISRAAARLAASIPQRRIVPTDPRRALITHMMVDASKRLGADQYQSVQEQIADLVPSYALGVVQGLSLAAREVCATNHILCLTTNAENLTMWSHYADSHRGAVVRFTCIPELDSVWGAAKQVRYSTVLPSLGDAEVWAERFWGLRGEITPSEMLDAFVLTKSCDWAYEDEWRIVDHGVSRSDFADCKFDRREISQIALGMRMSEADKNEVKEILNLSYRHCDLVQAQPKDNEFGLSFTSITL